MMMTLFLFGLSLLLTYAVYRLRCRYSTGGFSNASSKPPKRILNTPSLPKRILNPANLRAAGNGLIWQFTACEEACQSARTLELSRVDSLPLPLSDCGTEQCQCRYLPMRDLRVRQRRKTLAHHATFRAEAESIDRRRATERRREHKT
jgi:hypothetical protein